MRSLKLAMCVCLVAAMTASASAEIQDFLANSNQFGYSGSVTNVTKGLAAVAFPTPRDATLYFTNNVPLAGYAEWGNYNQILSNWYQHPTSNQNPGFFQLSDCDNDKAAPGDPLSTLRTVTSAVGGWTPNGGLWDFFMTVTGVEATAPIAASRLWQPDAGHAWAGTFKTYTYTITATGMSTEIVDGWRYNTTDPANISGSFDGTFASTQLVYQGPMVPEGDLFNVHLDFGSNLWDSTGWSNTYAGSDYGFYSSFGAPVPEPVTLVLLSIGSAGMLLRRRNSK